MRLPDPPDTRKLRAAIKHIVSLCDEDELGMTKLHKTLYYADMFLYATRGASITGCPYRKREHGPTCDLALTALSQEELETNRVNYFGYWKTTFSLKSAANTNELSSEEQAILSDSVEWVCKNNTAKGISEISHEGPWERVEYGEIIPYITAFSLFRVDVTDETLEWGRKVSEGVRFAGPEKETMARGNHRVLRSRLREARS